MSQRKRKGSKDEEGIPVTDLEIPTVASDNVKTYDVDSPQIAEKDGVDEQDEVEIAVRSPHDPQVEDRGADPPQSEAEDSAVDSTVRLSQADLKAADEDIDTDTDTQAINDIKDGETKLMPSRPPTGSSRSLVPSDDESSRDHVCPICLGGYEKGSMLFVSKRCDHIFHVVCISEWLTKQNVCPICRVEVVTRDEMVSTAISIVDTKSNRQSCHISRLF